MAVPLFRRQVRIQADQAALVQEAPSAAVLNIRRLTALESANGRLAKVVGADELSCHETTALPSRPYFSGGSGGQLIPSFLLTPPWNISYELGPALNIPFFDRGHVQECQWPFNKGCPRPFYVFVFDIVISFGDIYRII